MTKISSRQVRSLTRELLKTKDNAAKTARKVSVMSKEASTSSKKLSIAVLRNNTLSKNVRTMYDMFLKQQAIICQQRTEIRQFNAIKTPSPSTDNEDCAKTMIALSQQLCCDCLGTRTILKTKKHIRYSVECKTCKT